MDRISIAEIAKLAQEFEEAARTHRSGELPYFGDSSPSIDVVDPNPYDKSDDGFKRIAKSCGILQRNSVTLMGIINSRNPDHIFRESTWALLREMAKELYEARAVFLELNDSRK